MNEYNDNLHNKAKAQAFENARSLRRTETKAEQLLWEAIRANKVCDLKFRRQHPFGDFILDFYNHKMKLVIEVDGEIHGDPEINAYDKIRTQRLNESGLTVLRFSNQEVENNLKNVLKKIEEWFHENDFVKLDPRPGEANDIELKAPLSSRRVAGGEVNRLTKLFQHKQNGVLNMYCTAGYPQLNSTLEVIEALQDNGADIIELGIPYSDPIADGPVIQQSNMQALQNGISIPVLFQQLKNIRQQVSVPIVLMGYLNPVLQYGIEKFCAGAASVGVDGIILPDLPMHEFETIYRQYFEEHGLKFIFLVTPQTSEERVRKIDALSSGFIYAVSSSSTTGNTKPVEDQLDYFKKLKDMNLANPVLVGFGIKDKRTFDAACTYSNGGIIGSAYITAIKDATDIYKCTKDFIKTLKD